MQILSPSPAAVASFTRPFKRNSWADSHFLYLQLGSLKCCCFARLRFESLRSHLRCRGAVCFSELGMRVRPPRKPLTRTAGKPPPTGGQGILGWRDCFGALAGVYFVPPPASHLTPSQSHSKKMLLLPWGCISMSHVPRFSFLPCEIRRLDSVHFSEGLFLSVQTRGVMLRLDFLEHFHFHRIVVILRKRVCYRYNNILVLVCISC